MIRFDGRAVLASIVESHQIKGRAICYLRIRRAHGHYPIPERSGLGVRPFTLVIYQVECCPQGVVQWRRPDGLLLLDAGSQARRPTNLRRQRVIAQDFFLKLVEFARRLRRNVSRLARRILHHGEQPDRGQGFSISDSDTFRRRHAITTASEAFVNRSAAPALTARHSRDSNCSWAWSHPVWRRCRRGRQRRACIARRGRRRMR